MTDNRIPRGRTSRTFTKYTTSIVVGFFMFVILLSLTPWVNRSVAETAITLATTAILALLGVYQVVGHLDYRAKVDRGNADDDMADR